MHHSIVIIKNEIITIIVVIIGNFELYEKPNMLGNFLACES